MSAVQAIELNGRSYALPRTPTVVICVDGFDPDYLAHGRATGTMPALDAFAHGGFAATADAVMPTFTMPNNLSIVTGALPAVHGISGNYYLDRETGEEITITDAALLRCDTLPAALARAGVPTAVVTAKDKLRAALGHGLAGPCFSAEAPGATAGGEAIDVLDLVGRPAPDRYSADLSLFVLEAGIRLLETGRARLIYLSLSDYVQHAHAPDAAAAEAFHAALDAAVARLLDAGAVVALTGDHGMSDKCDAEGRPNVVYLEDTLAERFGAGAVRVICPITDPFVRHHGALGSFVRGYARDGVAAADLIAAARGAPGIAEVMTGREAADRFGLPADREGDFVAIAEPDAVIGGRRADHDLGQLDGQRLRSHGGLSEQRVPFLVSHPVGPAWQRRAASGALRNFDIFDAALNGVLAGSTDAGTGDAA